MMDVKAASAHFEELLRSQLARCEKMAQDKDFDDYAKLDLSLIHISQRGYTGAAGRNNR